MYMGDSYGDSKVDDIDSKPFRASSFRMHVSSKSKIFWALSSKSSIAKTLEELSLFRNFLHAFGLVRGRY
mgnify:CR=1 FL=1